MLGNLRNIIVQLYMVACVCYPVKSGGREDWGRKISKPVLSRETLPKTKMGWRGGSEAKICTALAEDWGLACSTLVGQLTSAYSSSSSSPMPSLASKGTTLIFIKPHNVHTHTNTIKTQHKTKNPFLKQPVSHRKNTPRKSEDIEA